MTDALHGSVLLYVHRNHKVHQDGETRTATSTFTQLLNSAPESQGSVFLDERTVPGRLCLSIPPPHSQAAKTEVTKDVVSFEAALSCVT